MSLNYTTYDRRRAQDSINPNGQADVMVVAAEDAEEFAGNRQAYWYAQVIGIHHTEVQYRDRDTGLWGPFARMDFLHIRWYEHDVRGPSSLQQRRLPRVSYVPADNAGAFGFLDPALVVRATHLIPAFHHGFTAELLASPSLARVNSENDMDWTSKYVNM